MTDLLTPFQESVNNDFSEKEDEINNLIFLLEIQEDLDKLKVEPSQACLDSILAYSKSIK